MKSAATKREVNGILIVDKPVGLSSNGVLQRVKRLFAAMKAGHGGSLDPLASGVLPVFFGSGTRLSGYALDATKRYVVRAKLGERTTTGDAEGEVIARSLVPILDEVSIRSLLAARFTGALKQVPPMYSALKVAGRPLYELARKGVEVVREERPIVIHDIQLLNLYPEVMELDVTCSKGTYIRTLVEDIGAAMGCDAHVATLRRTQAGSFSLADSYTLSVLEQRAGSGLDALDACLLPLDRGVSELPTLTISDVEAEELLHGRTITVAAGPGMVAVCDVAGKLLSIGVVDDAGVLRPQRNFAAPRR